jgi:hypothetical protein
MTYYITAPLKNSTEIIAIFGNVANIKKQAKRDGLQHFKVKVESHENLFFLELVDENRDIIDNIYNHKNIPLSHQDIPINEGNECFIEEATVLHTNPTKQTKPIKSNQPKRRASVALSDNDALKLNMLATAKLLTANGKYQKQTLSQAGKEYLQEGIKKEIKMLFGDDICRSLGG